MDTQASIWEERYTCGNSVLNSYEPWLEKWGPFLAARQGKALDIGCGFGFDTEWLSRSGFSVTAIDFSANAIEAAKQRIPDAAFRVVDLRKGLPFGDRTFSLCVASLSLHYFDRQTTRFIFNEIRRCLCSNGGLLFRVNAAGDVNEGALGTEELWDCVEVKGVWKQFFSRRKIDQILADLFRIESLEYMGTDRFGKPKAIYEVAAYAL